MTAQLPQNSPKVRKVATTGPASAIGRVFRAAPVTVALPPPAAVPPAAVSDGSGWPGSRSGVVRRARLGQERGAVENDPGDPPGTHQPATVSLESCGGHGEGKAPALHLDQRRLGQHDSSPGPRRQVVEL